MEFLNEFRSPAHRRLIFEEPFLYQLSLALRKERGGAAGLNFLFASARRAVRMALKAHSALQTYRRPESECSRRLPPTWRSLRPCIGYYRAMWVAAKTIVGCAGGGDHRHRKWLSGRPRWRPPKFWPVQHFLFRAPDLCRLRLRGGTADQRPERDRRNRKYWSACAQVRRNL